MAVGGYFSLQKPLRYLHLESAFPLRMMDPEKSRYPLQDRHFRDTPPTSRYHQTRTPSAMLHLGSALLVLRSRQPQFPLQQKGFPLSTRVCHPATTAKSGLTHAEKQQWAASPIAQHQGTPSRSCGRSGYGRQRRRRPRRHRADGAEATVTESNATTLSHPDARTHHAHPRQQLLGHLGGLGAKPGDRPVIGDITGADDEVSTAPSASHTGPDAESQSHMLCGTTETADHDPPSANPLASNAASRPGTATPVAHANRHRPTQQ